MKSYKDAMLAVLSDLHAGGSTAIFPDHQMQLTVGNREPGYAQKIIRGQWLEVGENIRKRRQKRRLIIVMNGDMVDGDHHGSVESFSTQQADQVAIANELIDEFLGMVQYNPNKGDKLYFTKGTEAHSGHQSQAEEQIAENFDAIPFIPATTDIPARRLHYQVKLRINGVRFNIQHEGATIGNRPWTADNGLYYLLKSKWLSHMMGEHALADWYIYSHRHQYMQATYEPNPAIKINARITPSWQFRTSYGEKFAEMDKVGAWYATIDADGTVKEYLDQLEYMPTEVMNV